MKGVTKRLKHRCLVLEMLAAKHEKEGILEVTSKKLVNYQPLLTIRSDERYEWRKK